MQEDMVWLVEGTPCQEITVWVSKTLISLSLLEFGVLVFLSPPFSPAVVFLETLLLTPVVAAPTQLTAFKTHSSV